MVLRLLSTYKIGRQVEVDEPGAELAILSVLGPAAAPRVATGPLGPEHAHASSRLAGRRAAPSRPISASI